MIVTVSVLDGSHGALYFYEVLEVWLEYAKSECTHF